MRDVNMDAQRRELGRSGLKVSPICFGGNVFSWTVDEKQAFDLLDAFAAAGFNFIDTADVYSKWVPGQQGGESETIIGHWLQRRGRRDDVIIATKVGMEMRGQKGLSPAHIRHSIDASLKRLQTDYVDLYQSHQADPNTPIADTLATYADLIAAGKVRAIGASNYTAAELQAALDASAKHGLPRYESLQPEYNLHARAGYESGLQDVCVRNGLGVIPYYSLASGFLTGKYRSERDFGKSARGGGIAKYFDARGNRILAALDAVAAEAKASCAAVALAWLLSRPGLTAPIASATSRAQLDDLIAAASLHLSADALARLDAASA
jgi:aryl-alcohol dehydrogenase-like predicted oxidoreductase